VSDLLRLAKNSTNGAATTHAFRLCLNFFKPATQKQTRTPPEKHVEKPGKGRQPQKFAQSLDHDAQSQTSTALSYRCHDDNLMHESEVVNWTTITSIDGLVDAFALTTDAQICARTGIEKGNFSRFRAGERPLSIQSRLLIANALGYSWAREALLYLMPEKSAEVLRKADNMRTKKLDRKRAKQKSKAHE
jgi:transcriptional regulator with XRE-family HTH domain